jgi:hypothetical protein
VASLDLPRVEQYLRELASQAQADVDQLIALARVLEAKALELRDQAGQPACWHCLAGRPVQTYPAPGGHTLIVHPTDEGPALCTKLHEREGA